ncbi:MAG: hypothetical protein ACP5HT_04405 [Conexivisphaera sp.]|jgi:hypothetical protein
MELVGAIEAKAREHSIAAYEAFERGTSHIRAVNKIFRIYRLKWVL